MKRDDATQRTAFLYCISIVSKTKHERIIPVPSIDDFESIGFKRTRESGETGACHEQIICRRSLAIHLSCGSHKSCSFSSVAAPRKRRELFRCEDREKKREIEILRERTRENQ